MTEPVIESVNPDQLDVFPTNSDNQWPILKDMWAFFSGNAGNIHILTVNSSTDVLADLKLAEKVGAKLTVCTTTDANLSYWNDIKVILKERMRSSILNNNPNYLSFAKCWVLSNRVNVVQGLPSVYTGSITIHTRRDLSGSDLSGADLSGADLSGSDLSGADLSGSDLSGSDLSGSEVPDLSGADLTLPLVNIDSIAINSYFDIVKIDYPGMERLVLNNLYEYGMRPSLILVRWENNPDTDQNVRAAAATLVNHGYTFVARVDNKYLYHYNDKPFYNLSSYSKPNQKNPMIETAIKYAKTAIFKQLSNFLGLSNEQSSN